MVDLGYDWFKKRVSELTGISFDSYRPEQMKRLMEKMLDHFNVKNYVELLKVLEGSPAKICEFRDNLTINVTTLFRDPQKWWKLNDELIPQLIAESEKDSNVPGIIPSLRGKVAFRAWSAGCSIGAEPYSLAILLEEVARSRPPGTFKYDILNSDLDATILKRAKEGIFNEKDIKDVPEKWQSKYFKEIERPPDDWAVKNNSQFFYQVVPALRRPLRFRLQNLLDDNIEKGFNLIMCRNVIIYFNQEIKESLFAKFNDALVPGGILFIGGTEIIFSPEKYGFKNISMCFYRKIN